MHNIGDVVVSMMLILLIVLFFASLALFIRRVSVTQSKSAENNKIIQQKLDRIIELLEEDKANK